MNAELAAVLAVDAPDASREVLDRLARAVASGPKTCTAPRWSGDAAVVAYAAPRTAAEAALSVVDALKDVEGLRIGGHYGVARRVVDPFGGADMLRGPAVSVPCDIQFSAPPGTIQISEDFAAALNAGPAEGCPRTEYVGDLPPTDTEDEIRLFSLSR